MIERGFPTQLYQDQTDPVSGKTIQVAVTDPTGAPVQSQEALRMKQALIDGLSAVELPENPLDQLVNHFGEANVSELTGALIGTPFLLVRGLNQLEVGRVRGTRGPSVLLGKLLLR